LGKNVRKPQGGFFLTHTVHPARHITGQFGDESFQTITCTGTDNSKQTGENTPKKHEINKLAPRM